MSSVGITLLLLTTIAVGFPLLFALWMRWIGWVNRHIMPN